MAGHISRKLAVSVEVLRAQRARTGLDWPISDHLAAGLLFELERNSIDSSPRIDELYAELSRQDLERLRFDEGLTLLGSVRPSLALDLRDDPVAPHAGLWARVEGDWSNSLPGQSPVNFFKLSGTVTGYVPVATRTTLALSVGGGATLVAAPSAEASRPVTSRA